MSNPDGNTGYRTVKYVKPGETIVYYNDRELTIKTHGESREDFASKVKARTGKVPKGYKTREQAYAERRAAAKKRTQEALAKKKEEAAEKRAAAAKEKAAKEKAAKAKVKSKATTGSKARTKTTAPTTSAQRTSRKTSGRASAPKTNFEKLLASGKYVIE